MPINKEILRANNIKVTQKPLFSRQTVFPAHIVNYTGVNKILNVIDDTVRLTPTARKLTASLLKKLYDYTKHSSGELYEFLLILAKVQNQLDFCDLICVLFCQAYVVLIVCQ